MATSKRGATQTQRARKAAAERPVVDKSHLRTSSAKVASKASNKSRWPIVAKELDAIDRKGYPLAELSDAVQSQLYINTSARALLTAILQGPAALLDELTHAWIPHELVPWVTQARNNDTHSPAELPEMAQENASKLLADPPHTVAWARALYDGPEGFQRFLAAHNLPCPAWVGLEAPPVEPSPYAVMQLHSEFPVPAADALNAEALHAMAVDMLHQLANSRIHSQLRSYIRSQAGTMAQAFAEAVQGHVGSVIPVNFQLPTTVSVVVMLHEVRFGFNSAANRMTLDWVAMPALQIPQQAAGTPA